ncbi:MAG TPA: CBS domain-containing protein [Leptospiraceae bacterium]|nr:CBS domain-containing protein [Leptospiraceae bacterium]HMW03712.1 CBS domain-containing protein [Leptospiraceae bacterium]HMX31825.1 CBS domain-containing protein [Leptospiraceae bacterium]HMY29692.1 CBS domain-containing protein [Leptospiraceae bacterium]HMZ64032.1 CBS domain-containing protein [Leptospiraceae bacterium]
MKSAFNGLKVKDVMTKNVFTVNTHHTWQEVARKLSSKNIHHIVVVDSNHKPVSVMSVSDFLRFAINSDKSILEKTLEEVKPHHRLISLKAEDHAYDAVNEMNNHLVESVVVLDENGRLEGIVTSKDLMNVIFFDEKFQE